MNQTLFMEMQEMIYYQEMIFKFMRTLNSDSVSNDDLNEMVNYIKSKLNIAVKEDFARYTKESKVEYLQTILNRPIRVCGMVKNEGEPGGGPFWVADKKGKTFFAVVCQESSSSVENVAIICVLVPSI